MENNNQKDSGLIRRILLQAKPYRSKIVFYFLLTLLSTPLALLSPIPLKIVVDNVIGEQELPNWLDLMIPEFVEESTQYLLLFAIVFFLLIKLFSSLHGLYSGNILLTKITKDIQLDFRSKLLDHAQRLSIGFHDANGPDYSSYRIHYDTGAIQNIIFSTIIPMVSAVVTFFSMFYIIFLLDKKLALIALIISPLVFILANQYRNPLRKGWRVNKRLDHTALAVINEALTMLRVIKAFGKEDHEIKRFNEASKKAIKSTMRVQWIQASLTLLMSLTTAVGTVLVLYIGTLHVLEGILSLGSLLVIMSYLSQLYSPLKTIGRKIAGLQSYLTSAERAFSLLDEPLEAPILEGALPITETKGHIIFENVDFSYNDRDQILHNISVKIQSGMRVGIAGRTGAGKSTLINLLFRFYDPDSGRILLDGNDIQNYKLRDYRKLFSLVLQDTLLVSGTIRENIAYGAFGCTEEEIVHAAKVANAHDFIRKLPEAYGTKVGEKGMQLSGGERQRIALARAFITNAPIMVFDEPTSSVDTKTETAIVEAMDKLMKGRTAFIIAHRLSTLESCDLLLIIDEGRIIKSTTNVKETIREAILSGGLQVNAQGEFVDQ